MNAERRGMPSLLQAKVYGGNCGRCAQALAPAPVSSLNEEADQILRRLRSVLRRLTAYGAQDDNRKKFWALAFGFSEPALPAGRQGQRRRDDKSSCCIWRTGFCLLLHALRIAFPCLCLFMRLSCYCAALVSSIRSLSRTAPLSSRNFSVRSWMVRRARSSPVTS